MPNTRLSAQLPVGKQAHKAQGVKDEREEEEEERRRRINLDHHQISRAMLGCIKATSPANEGQTGEGGRGWWGRAEGWTAGLCGGAADR